MQSSLLARIAAACGAVFAVALFVASGSGHDSFSIARGVAGVAAITLAIPFIAYLSSRLRTAEAGDGWLSTVALTTGVAGIVLKLASVGPELAIHRAHLADGSTAYKALDEISGGLTILCLYPLAIFCATTALVALRTHALPRWLGAGAGLTAAALVVNGVFLRASFVPGFLLFIVWTLLASIQLLRRPAALAAPAEAREQVVVA